MDAASEFERWKSSNFTSEPSGMFGDAGWVHVDDKVLFVMDGSENGVKDVNSFDTFKKIAISIFNAGFTAGISRAAGYTGGLTFEMIKESASLFPHNSYERYAYNNAIAELQALIKEEKGIDVTKLESPEAEIDGFLIDHDLKFTRSGKLMK